jgi:DNA-binding GntR family transcriptional regulator
MVNSLRRLDVVVCGEAVSAAPGIADHHATFAAVLAKAATAASASAPPPAATGKDRTVVANKAAGAEPLLGVQGVARGLLRGTDVLITYVQPTSVEAAQRVAARAATHELQIEQVAIERMPPRQLRQLVARHQACQILVVAGALGYCLEALDVCAAWLKRRWQRSSPCLVLQHVLLDGVA